MTRISIQPILDAKPDVKTTDIGAVVDTLIPSSHKWKNPSKPAVHRIAAGKDIKTAIPYGQSV